MKKNKYLITSIIFLVLFIINTILVCTDSLINVDRVVNSFFLLFKSDFFTSVMKVITFFGSTAFIVGFCAIVFFFLIYKKKKTNAYYVAGTLIVSTIVNSIIKIIIQRPRPEYITVVEKTFSYPSGHTMASLTLYGFLIYLIITSKIQKNYKIIINIFLSLLILFIAISRIYLGAHYFSDIMGALFLASTLLFSIFYLKKL